jgi:heptosyltransferase-2
MNLGVFLPNWIGDVVMATPALRALRNQFGPTARLVGIMRPYVADVLAGSDWFDEQLFYNPRGSDPQLRGLAFVRNLRRAQLDTVVLFPNSLRSGWLAWLSGARRRVGYVRNLRGPLLTDRLYPMRFGRELAPTPTLDYYLQLTYALGCPKESPRIELATLPADERMADIVWNTLGLTGRRVVVFNSGGAFGSAKLWPAEHFAALAERIVDSQGCSVLVVCGPGERAIAEQIVAQASRPHVVSLADPRLAELSNLPLGLTKACVRRAELMVTTDSGPRHFAAAFDVPVITLFGSMPAWLSETHYPRAIHLRHDVPCSPCMQRTCPLGHHSCMRDLSVERVYDAVSTQLARRPARAA